MGLLASAIGSAACKEWIGLRDGIPMKDDGSPTLPTSASDAGVLSSDAALPDADDEPVPATPIDAAVARDDALSCAARGLGFDANTQACVVCQDLPAEATELFVSRIAQTVDPGAQGSRECPFSSITKALAYAANRPSVLTIRIGPGTYTQGSETFPLVVRGIELIGAGQELTRIVGQGAYVGPTTLGAGLAGVTVQAAMIIGDSLKQTVISELSLSGTQRPSSGSGNSSLGMLCDQGDSHGGVETKTTVRNVLFGGNVGVEALITSTTAPSGRSFPCHFGVENSEFHSLAGTAIRLSGAARDEQSSTGPRVTLDTKGTRFVNTEGSFAAIDIGAGAARTIVRDASFAGYDGTNGAVIAQGSVLGAFEITGSRFEKNSIALTIDCRTQLDELQDNVFVDNVIGLGAGPPATEDKCSGPVGGIAHARNNTFSRHSISVFLRQVPANFGKPDDPGKNDFGCNGSFFIENSIAGQSLTAYGNFWDHAVGGIPNILYGQTGNIPKTTDDVRILLEDPNLDFRGASVSTTPCPNPPTF